MTFQRGKPNVRLRDERVRRHWSQQELADMIGATLNTVSRWERGLTDCSPYFRNKLAELFGKSASQLWLVPDPDEEGTHPALYDPVLPAARKLIGRDELLGRLKSELHNTQEGGAVALVGMPGVGKSAISLAFAHDAQIRDWFYEGILWVDAGPHPNILNILSRWGALLGTEPSANSDLTVRDAWLLGLRMAIGTRRMLFVIDNLWRLEDAMVLMHVGGLYCTYLVTTRFTNIALYVAGERMITVPELSIEDGFQLLEKIAPGAVRAERERMVQLVQYVGGLPLALVLIGQYMRLEAHTHQARRLQLALDNLTHSEKRLQLEQPLMTLAHSTVSSTLSLQAAISLSDQHLSRQAQDALRQLSVFPAKPSTFSEQAAQAITGAPVEVFDQLCDAGLLEARGRDRYSLHPCIVDYASLHTDRHIAEHRFTHYYGELLTAENMDQSFEQEQINLFAALFFACKHRMGAQREKLGAEFQLLKDVGEFDELTDTALVSISSGLRTTEDFDALEKALYYVGKLEWMQRWACPCEREYVITDKSYLIKANGVRKHDETFAISQTIS
ncbi:MAG: helix-turn-helix domain-containing protein [Ktedonobacteraceae bacterium]|nr:helix-turn-helix domain-containing protein [Ktedonobacteraceae bacterium]